MCSSHFAVVSNRSHPSHPVSVLIDHLKTNSVVINCETCTSLIAITAIQWSTSHFDAKRAGFEQKNLHQREVFHQIIDRK